MSNTHGDSEFVETAFTSEEVANESVSGASAQACAFLGRARPVVQRTATPGLVQRNSDHENGG